MGHYSHSTYVSSVNILISDTHLTAGETMTVTFMFNEGPWWGPFARFRLRDGDDKGVPIDTPHGTLSNMVRDSDDTRIYTATFTPDKNINKAVGRITLDLNDLLYQYGTRPCGTFQSVEYTVDTMPSDAVPNPHLNHVTIRLGDDVVKAGETMTVTFEFKEAPRRSSFSTADVTVSHGTLSNLKVDPNNDKIYTATFTPDEHKNRVVGRISLDLANIKDSDGNYGTGVFQSEEYIVDTMPPANVTNVFIRLSDNHLTAGEKMTVTFEFNEAPWRGSFTLTDLVAPNGVLSDLVESPHNDKVYTATFTPNANTNRSVGRITLNLMNVSDGRYTDDQGHPATGVRQSIEYTVDTMPRNASSNPALNRVNIRLSDTLLTANENMTVTFEFNEGPLESSFTISDIVAPLGVLHDLVRDPNNARIYTVKFTPHNKTSQAVGRITLDLAKLEGNGKPGTGVYQSAEYTVDNLPPARFSTVSIRLSDSHLTARETATVTFEFNEGPVEDSFTRADVVAPHGRLSNLVRDPNNARIYTAKFTPYSYADAHGVRGRISLDLANITDEARNPGTGVYQSSEYTIENAASSSRSARLNHVVIRLSDSYLSRGEAVTVTFAFNVAPSNKNFLRDVVSPLGTLTNLNWDYNHNEKICSATFTPNVDMAKGVGRITLDLSKVDDEDGNAGVGTYQSAEYTVDTVRPRLDRITVAASHLNAGETSTVTFAFSKEVSGTSLREALDLSNASGTLSEPVSVDGGKTWTAILTPSADTRSASGVIRVNINSVRDTHGNAGLGDPVSSNTYTVGTVRPTLAASGHSIDDDQLGIGETAYIKIKFSEPVKGLDASDVVLAPGSGSVSRVAAWQPAADGSSDTWELALDAPGAASTNNPISVNLAGVSTRTGSTGLGTVATGLRYSVDTTRPTLLSTRISYGAGESDTVLKHGEKALVSFTFSEPVTDFGLNDVLMFNGLRDGMLSHLTSTGDGSVWTATLSAPTPNVTSSNNTFRVNMAGVTDRAGNAGEGVVATGVSYDIDTIAGRPSLRIMLADSTLAVGESTTVTFSFNEAVTGFDAADIVLTSGNGTLSDLAVGADGKTWTATFTPTANTEVANNTVRVDLAGVRNAAGTAGVGSASSANYVVDTVRPMLRSLVIEDRLLAANEETTVTITFSQAIDANSFTLDDLEIIDSLTQRNQSINGLRGTLSNLRTTDGGVTWKVTLKSPSADNMPDNRIAIKLRDISDSAGNTVGGGNVPGDTGGTYIANDQAYANDSSRPQVTWMAMSGRNLRSGGTLTFTVAFNEPVTGFTLDDISCSAGASGGTISDLNSSDGGRTWVITITAPTFRTSASNVKVFVTMGAAHGIRDLAGNMSPEGGLHSRKYNVDTSDLVISPTATITLADNHLMAGESTTVTIAFNDRVNGFTADDIILTNANGTLGPLTANADGKTWTATFTPTANISSASNTISVNLFGVTNDGPADTIGFGQASSASYSISTVRPSATITLGSTSLTMRETTTVRFAFSEAVTGFTAQDIVLSDANGTLSTLTADADGKTWTATFTPTVNVQDASNTIRVNLAGVTNAAGNTGEGTASSANYVVDTVRTMLRSLVIEDRLLAANEETTVTITFSQAIDANSFTLDDLEIIDSLTQRNQSINGLRGTLSNLRTTDGGVTWKVTLKSPSADNMPDNRIAIKLRDISDSAGNTVGGGNVPGDPGGTYIANDQAYANDSSPPAVIRWVIWDRNLRSGGTLTFTVTFNEPVMGFSLDDIHSSAGASGGTISDMNSNDGGKTWTITITAPTFRTSASHVKLSITMGAAHGIRDLAGNMSREGGTHSGGSYNVDTRDLVISPTATITLADKHLMAGESTTVTIAFSETVSEFTAADVVLSDANGTLGPLTANADGKTWTAIFTPAANTEDSSNTIRVNLAGVSSATGQAGVGHASSANFSVDTVRPSVRSVALADSNLSGNESTTVTIVFSEALNRSLPSTDSKAFTLSDLTMNPASSGGIFSDLRTNDGITWQCTLTAPPAVGLSTTGNRIQVNLSGVTDLAGNQGEGTPSFASFSYDLVRPTATITLADTALTAGETTTVTFTFSEPVNGFTAEDIVLTGANGTLGALTPNAARTVWTATFTPTANVNVPTNTIGVNLTGVTDEAGNAGTGTTSSANYSVDTRDRTGPTATITLADSALTAGETTTVSFTFNEPVNGFDTSDIVCTSGTLSVPTANTGRTVWTAIFTPTANANAPTNTIRVNLAGVTDDAGNAGTGSASSANYSVHTTRLTATITLADTSLTLGETTTVTFSFNERVTDFTSADIVLSDANGALGPLTANADGKTWSATFTPAANVNDATNTISVNLTGVTGATGRTGEGRAISANYSVNTVPLSATITLADTQLAIGKTTTVTIAFSETVSEFTAADVVLSDANGTLGPLTANADGKTWTAIFTPAANTEDSSNTIRVNLAGVSSATGQAGVGHASSANYTVDTVRPSVRSVALADSNLSGNESTTVTIVFSEALNRNLPSTDSKAFTLSDLTMNPASSGGIFSDLRTNDGITWQCTLTAPPAVGLSTTGNRIQVNLSGVTDLAGNQGEGTPSFASFSYDLVRPTVSITLADSTLTAGETTTVTFTFSEPVNGFTAEDIVLTGANGTLGALTPNAARTVWTATFTPTANVNVPTNTIGVNLTGVTDEAGNAGTGTTSSANYSVDTRDRTGPTATITLADSALTAGETTTVSFTFNEPVNGFDTSDIVCTSGTLSVPTANTGRTVWTAIFTPTANANAPTNTIRVNLAGVTDDAGNAGTGSASSANYSVHTTRLTATITLADTSLTLGETTTVTFSFNERVTGFTSADIVLSDANGALGPLTANADGKTWSATFTPAANVNDATNTISVNLTGVTNPTGRTGEGRAISANYSVNTVPLSATITLADTQLAIGKTTTVTFAFSETVSEFTAADVVLSDANGTLGPLTANADGKTWTATFTPAANTEDSSNTIRVNLAGVSSATGQAGVGHASSANYTVDTVRPSVRSVALADSNLSGNESTTVTIVFSEALNRNLPSTDSKAFTLSDLTMNPASSGGIFSDLRTNDGITWQCTLTAPPAGGLSTTGNRIQVNLSGVTDLAGNQGEGTPSFASFSYDLVRPTVSITLADSTLTAGETTTVTFTFSEPVNGFTAADIVLSNANGTLGSLTPNAARTVWSATFTPTANVNDASNTISVNLTGVSDDAGNAGVGSASSANYTIDTTRPTATITLADSTLTVGETTTVTFTFSEPVNGFTAEDILLPYTNDTLGALTANAARTVWTATYTPAANVSSRINTIRVNTTGITDDAGNTGTSMATSANYTIDTTRPTATITLADTALTVGETTTVTFTFSEPVTGFTAADIVLSNANGTLGTLTANAARTVWTATFTPTANVNDASNTISVNLTGVSDDAGNAGVGSASSANYTVDTTATVRRPGATIELADNNLKAGETTTVTFTFSEPVTGFTLDDVVLSRANGSLGPLMNLSGDGRIWYATFTAADSNVHNTRSSISVNLAGVTNAAGTAGQGNASSASYSVDAVRPGASITLADSTLTAGETTTVTITFSERVTGFTRSNLVLDNAHGELGELVAGADGRTWSATFTPRANVERSASSIGLNLSGITDAAGNPAQGPANAGFTVDTMPPRATVTLARSALKAGQSTTVTFTFSESVTGFTAEDIVLGEANGSLGPLSSNADGSVWSATFTPNADTSDASNRIRVNLAGVTDRAGNVGLGFADSANYTVDTVRPGVTITLADNTLGAGEVTTVSFLFNKPVTGFTLEDIDLSDANGSLSGLRSSGDGRLWHAEFTPAANTEDASNTIRVNLAGVSDAAGNTGVGSASSANYRIDSVRPTVAITLADSSLTVGETTTVTFRFSEPVSDFNAGDIVLGDANGYLGPLSAAADGKTWTAIFTPRDNLNDATNTIGVNLAGVSDAAGNRGQGLASSANYRLDTRAGDTTAPTATITLSDSELKAGETSTVTIAFSEPVTGLTTEDLVLTNAEGRLDQLTLGADGKTWSAIFTPTANIKDTSNSIGLKLSGVRDLAGNAGVGNASSANFSIDTVRPTVSITLAETSLRAGQSTSVTFRFSESVTGFSSEDIVLSDANGTLGALTAHADGKSWSATFTPTANVSDASNTISVNLAGVRDQAGNAGVGSASSANFAIDLVRPSATVTLASSSLKAGQSTTVTFRFSESVADFTLGDIVLGNANGSLSALSANADGKTWTATFTPTVDVVDASNTISVNLTGVRDLAGNAGVGSASSANFSIDTVRPTATITLADSDLRAGESSTVSFSFSTPVTGFGLEDIDLSDANGALGALRAGADGKSWSATFTPTAAVQDAGNRISVNLAGVTNTAGNAGEGRASSANFAVNTRPSSTSSQAVEQAEPVTSATAPATPVSAEQQQAQSTADDDGTSKPTPEGLERPIQLSQTKQDAGRSEQFSLYVDLTQEGVNGYWAKDHSGSWVNLASAAYGGKMEVQGERLRLDYRITDGGQFDADGKADGSISAAGAAAYMPLAGQAADVQAGGV